MKQERWTGWAIYYRDALVVFDARCPIYWKRNIAAQEAEVHGLSGAKIVKVQIAKAKGAPAETPGGPRP